jgi:hypothetical protein
MNTNITNIDRNGNDGRDHSYSSACTAGDKDATATTSSQPEVSGGNSSLILNEHDASAQHAASK